MNRCLIINPKSGSLKTLDTAFFQEIERIEPSAIHVTAGPGSAESYALAAAESEKYDEIVVAGGDGTLNEVINGIAGCFDRIHVGIIPLGTGNDFARSLGLPATLKESIDVLLNGQLDSVDLVRAQSEQLRYFANVSAGGFSGLVDEKLTPELKKTWGPLAYLRSAAAALPQLQGYGAIIELDGQRLDLVVYNVVVANGRYVAGGLPIAPQADLHDGKLDVVLIESKPAADMALLAAQILMGKHLENAAVVHERAARVSVRSEPGMWFNVDGELVGNEPILFEAIPRALQVVVAKT
jgi:diacylglycerol kinase (ATP)